MSATESIWRQFVRRPEWFADAACREHGPEMFYDSGARGGKPSRRADAEARAVAICQGCPVRLECLAYGLVEEHGVWGGRTEAERAAMRESAGIAPLRPTMLHDPCGTNAGFSRHHRDGTPPCPACTDAHRRKQEVTRPSRAGAER